MASIADILIQTGDVARVTSNVTGSALSILGKVRRLTLPSISTQSGVSADVEMTASGQPGKATLSRTAPMVYYIGGAIILLLIIMLLRK